MLEGLGDINWAGLTHAYGPATDVPGLLRALAAPPDAVEEEDTASGEDPLSLLCNLVNHQASIYPATPYVVPFLVELLAAGPPERRPALLYVLGSFAGYAGPAPPDPFGRAPVAAWAPDWDAAGCVCNPTARAAKPPGGAWRERKRRTSAGRCGPACARAYPTTSPCSATRTRRCGRRRPTWPASFPKTPARRGRRLPPHCGLSAMIGAPAP